MERALELAWEAYCAGSFPVGCVIADGDGTVVAEGRNRIGDATAPAGRVHATSLAHAEIDALSQLRAGRYGDHVLYTSVEPCLLCRSAAVMSHIGEVRFLAADPLWAGLDRLTEINEHVAAVHPRWSGPGVGTAASFAFVLPLAVLLVFSANPGTLERYERYDPELLQRARRVVDEDRWPSRDMTLHEAVAHLRPVLDD